MQYSRAELFEITHALGHRDPCVFETRGGGFFSTCSCGYISTTRSTFVHALEAGVHHALSMATLVVRQAQSSGREITPELLAEAAARQPAPKTARTSIPHDAQLVAS